MRILLLIVLLFSIWEQAIGQPTTFVKKIDRDAVNYEVATSLLIENEDIYVGLGVACSTNCTREIKYDKFGTKLWSRTSDLVRRSNRNGLNVREDTLFLAGYTSVVERNLNFLKINKKSGELFSNVTINLTNETTSEPVAHGSVMMGNSLLIYGWTNMPDDTTVGIIQWYDLSKDSNGSFKKYRTARNKYNDVVELQAGYDGNLHYISFNRQKVNTDNIDSRRITTISPTGEILREFDYNHKNEGIYFPMSLTIAQNNDYIFNAWQPDSIFDGNGTVQLVRTTELGKPLWTYNWPSFFVGEKAIYLVGDLKVTSNGDIIGCGSVQPPGFNDGYIFRISGDGKMLWERRINIKDNLDDRYDIFAFTCLAEDSAGNIVVAGEYRNSFYKDQNGILVKMDANGCIEGYNCTDRIVLDKFTVALVELTKSEATFDLYPNPVSHVLQIDCLDSSLEYGVEVLDLLGRVLLSKTNQSSAITLDCSELLSGMYIVNITNSKHQVLHTQKIVK